MSNNIFVLPNDQTKLIFSMKYTFYLTSKVKCCIYSTFSYWSSWSYSHSKCQWGRLKAVPACYFTQMKVFRISDKCSIKSLLIHNKYPWSKHQLNVLISFLTWSMYGICIYINTRIYGLENDFNFLTVIFPFMSSSVHHYPVVHD